MLFMDGSCKAPLSCYARAAGAILQFNAAGALVRGITFVVPAGWPQTAASSEHLAYQVAHDYARQGMVPVTDCGSVFQSALSGKAYATHPKRPWAAVWSDIRCGWLEPPLKVKAHFSREQCAAIGQEHLWAGNQAVDRAAKSRAALALPPEGICADLDAVEAARVSFYCGAAKLLAAYPAPAALVDPACRQAVSKLAATQLVLYRGHELVQVPLVERWVCPGCSASCSSLRRTDLLTRECQINSSAVAQCIAGARAGGHVPWVVFVQGSLVPVVCCEQCGCHSEAGSNVIGLARECMHKARHVGAPERAGPSKGARYRLGRFLKGKHPTRELALDGPFRMLPSELAWRPVPPPARPGDGDVGSSAACAACVGVAAVAELSFPEVGDGEPVHAAFAYDDDDPWPEGPPDLDDFPAG